MKQTEIKTLEQIKKDMNNHSYVRMADDYGRGFEHGDYSIRDWGNWENPNNSNEQDCDNQVLTKSTETELMSLINNWRKQFPTMAINAIVGEKNWLYIRVNEK